MLAYNYMYQIIYLIGNTVTDIKSPSYMEMALHLEGRDQLILRIPTLWDTVELQWIGFIQTPKTKKIIKAIGQDSFDLQNNFNIEFYKAFQDESLAEELYSMFKPKEEWK